MSAENIVVYGAGGHGKVVADILLAGGRRVVGFIDDGKPRGTMILGFPIMGDGEWFFQNRDSCTAVALGIGNNDVRADVLGRCVAVGLPLVTAIHPSAAVSRSAKIGSGTVVMANACINPDATVGIGAIINTGAVIEHDCTVGEYAQVGPSATMAGAAKLGAYSQLWTGAVLLPQVSVGERTVVGAGAVVLNDLADHIVAVGVPARVLQRVKGAI